VNNITVDVFVDTVLVYMSLHMSLILASYTLCTNLEVKKAKYAPYL